MSTAPLHPSSSSFQNTYDLFAQPNHFYGASQDETNSSCQSYLDPASDPLATRGIPVFKPTMEEFRDFEGYMTRLEPWGSRSGIVKVIPPKEWSDSLPPLKEQLRHVKIKTPIEQHMTGRSGLFRQENVEKRKLMSVREWVELCRKEEFRAPGVDEVGLHARSIIRPKTKQPKTTTKARPVPKELIPKSEELDCPLEQPQHTDRATSIVEAGEKKEQENVKQKAGRINQSRLVRQANLAHRLQMDNEFLESFDPHQDWLPPDTMATDYTQEFCQKLERQYWRNCGLGNSAWYGADTQGSLYTDETIAWNVAHLDSTLSRLLPYSSQGVPGVNTPYLYFGMWRATFAWHVEDMDLFSINYIHFGAPKFWYAIPQGRATGLEHTMRGYFPQDISQCPQFLRHKSFLASPTVLAKSSCKPNYLVQHSGEFVITFPRGYHAGFNLGLNCAESVNFALDSWLEMGKRAKACECISDSVRIDVVQLLADRAEEGIQVYRTEPSANLTPSPRKVKKDTKNSTKSLKRKSDTPTPEPTDGERQIKKIRIKPLLKPVPSASTTPAPSTHKPTITLKLGPRPPEPERFPCCLCPSLSKSGLLKVHEPPIHRKDVVETSGNPTEWMAHEECARIVPETWVDEMTNAVTGILESLVFGVDAIVKDRWNLKCSACTKLKHKIHGAPIQCTKGKCSKAFHVSCARDDTTLGIVFNVLQEIEKEVVLLNASSNSNGVVAMQTEPDGAAPFGSVARNNSGSDTRVLKVIKKLDVQMLCPQHNPERTAVKKAQKQDKIKSELVALPSMSRIKIRVSAGVFEVSLVRVIEETCSVEVLWDRGMKREFKWGSVVFGATEGPVQQKPSEPAAEVTGPAAVVDKSPTTSNDQPSNTSQYQVPTYPSYAWGPRMSYEAWSYQGQGHFTPYGGTKYGSSVPPMSYGYGSYYPTSSTTGYNPYLQYPNPYSGLNWQQPYRGPVAPQSAACGQATPTSAMTPSLQLTPTRPTYAGQKEDEANSPVSTSGSSSAAPSTPPSTTLAVTANATTLASLDPSQIATLFGANPQLKDIMLAAVEKARGAAV